MTKTGTGRQTLQGAGSANEQAPGAAAGTDAAAAAADANNDASANAVRDDAAGPGTVDGAVASGTTALGNEAGDASAAKRSEVEDLQSENRRLAEELESERTAHRATQAEADKHREAAKSAKASARVTKHPHSQRARKVGPVDEPEAAEAEKFDAFRGGVADALDGDVTIVASDGKKEIPQLAPIGISGDAWVDRQGKRMLNQPVVFSQSELDLVEINGFGLFVDDEQIAWCALPEPIRVPRNQNVKVEHTILF